MAVGEAPPEPAGRRIWESPELGPLGQPATRLDRLPDGYILRFHGEADFYLRDDRIVVVPAPDASPAVVELRLLGPVLAFWLERAGVVTLHASAVVVDGRAVAFLAGNHAGKTNLALAMMARGGALLTDDLLAVEGPPPGTAEEDATFLARPGYPQVRLWVPDVERHLPGRGRRLPTVHPAYDKRRVPVGEGGIGRFHPEPAPLAAVLLPEHRPDVATPRLDRLPPGEALVALLAGSYLPRLAPAAGLQEGRMEQLGRLVERIPVRRLVYPRGLDRLPEVVAALPGLLGGGEGPDR